MTGACIRSGACLQYRPEEIEGRLSVAVQLVDEGDDGRIAHAADLHELLRLRLNTLAAVDDHQGAIHRRQDPVGVFGKILMARRIQEIDLIIPIGEIHHGGRNGDAPFLFDRHPVAGRVTPRLAGLDRPGHLDGPAKEQEFFRQGRLPGVGVTDDAEGATSGDFLLMMHCLISPIMLVSGNKKRAYRPVCGVSVH
jgi:hypothetical protein